MRCGMLMWRTYPSNLLKYTAHLLRHTVKKCPQRITDTPAVLFYCIPCIYTVSYNKVIE